MIMLEHIPTPDATGIYNGAGKWYISLMGSGLNIDTETRIVALLARGDTYEEIRQQIEGGVSDVAIRAVKKRNKANLEIISQKMLIKATEDAGSIKQKANKIISHKLDNIDTNQLILDKARQDWLNDVIDYKTYEKILRKHHDASLGELVSVSKEMHSQSTAEDRPPADAKDMAALVAAIKSGDETKITQVVFNAKSDQPLP